MHQNLQNKLRAYFIFDSLSYSLPHRQEKREPSHAQTRKEVPALNFAVPKHLAFLIPHNLQSTFECPAEHPNKILLHALLVQTAVAPSAPCAARIPGEDASHRVQRQQPTLHRETTKG